MTKNDIKLIVVAFLVAIILTVLLYWHLGSGSTATEASIIYENEEILRVDLTINKIYEVEAANGKVVIEVKDNQIRVTEENSPLHICSIQGWSQSKGKPIICLPNKLMIVIIEEDDNGPDDIVR